MPTATWNKRWAQDLERYRSRGVVRHYGDQWGDPELDGIGYVLRKLRHGRRIPGNLARVRRRFLEPYVTSDSAVLEIGGGGGRWTHYLLRAREVTVVDLNADFFAYIRERFPDAGEKLRFYETSGYELAGVADDSIDFVFTFGTFVHIDPEGIDAYLGEIGRVLRPGAPATVHYADRTKKFFEGQPADHAGFSDMSAEKLEAMATRHGLEVVEHDRKSLNHSNVALLRRPDGR